MGLAGTLRYSVLVQQCDFLGAQEAGWQAWMGPGTQSQGSPWSCPAIFWGASLLCPPYSECSCPLSLRWRGGDIAAHTLAPV